MLLNCAVCPQSSNLKSDPPQKIHRITNTYPNNPAAPFWGHDPITPLAKLKLRRIHPKPGDSVCNGNEDSDDDVFDAEGFEVEEGEELTEMEKKKLMMMQGGEVGQPLIGWQVVTWLTWRSHVTWDGNWFGEHDFVSKIWPTLPQIDSFILFLRRLLGKSWSFNTNMVPWTNLILQVNSKTLGICVQIDLTPAHAPKIHNIV